MCPQGDLISNLKPYISLCFTMIGTGCNTKWAGRTVRAPHAATVQAESRHLRPRRDVAAVAFRYRAVQRPADPHLPQMA